jgi:hypothetical protein
VHGIILAFKCPAGSGRCYSATYLPEVAQEQRESVTGHESVGRSGVPWMMRLCVLA